MRLKVIDQSVKVSTFATLRSLYTFGDAREVQAGPSNANFLLLQQFDRSHKHASQFVRLQGANSFAMKLGTSAMSHRRNDVRLNGIPSHMVWRHARGS